MKSVLITGGTGSFGRAFTLHLLASEDAPRVCIFSRDEHKQAAMRQASADHPNIRWFIGDVRDRERLRRAMEGVDLVIHAAALKRVEVGEYNPTEMVRTNVVGAINVIEAAADAGVRKVVALSTDKACEPVNAYGASKLMLEKLFLAANNTRGAAGPIFAVTRYGNVAGSAGSVIPTWRALIAGGTTRVPVTNPQCTRFWMSMDQAVELVASTAARMTGGEFVVPELEAYRLSDLAAALDVEMDVVGMRPGEKLHESMLPGMTSADARRLTVDDLRFKLKEVW